MTGWINRSDEIRINLPISTALTCCDKNPSAGPRTYRLVAIATNLSGEQTIILNQGTLTGAQIEN